MNKGDTYLAELALFDKDLVALTSRVAQERIARDIPNAKVQYMLKCAGPYIWVAILEIHETL